MNATLTFPEETEVLPVPQAKVKPIPDGVHSVTPHLICGSLLRF